jgi:hypothetical protein
MDERNITPGENPELPDEGIQIDIDGAQAETGRGSRRRRAATRHPGAAVEESGDEFDPTSGGGETGETM